MRGAARNLTQQGEWGEEGNHASGVTQQGRGVGASTEVRILASMDLRDVNLNLIFARLRIWLEVLNQDLERFVLA